MSKLYYGEEAERKILENTKQNIFDYMDASTKDIEDFTAMTYFGGEISYKELKENIFKYANTLKRYGLEKGDTITLCLPNVPEVVYYKYAAWLLGIKTHLVDPRFNPEGILELTNKSHSTLFVSVIDAFSAKIAPIIDRLNVENVVLVAPSDSMKVERIRDTKNVLAKALYTYKEFELYLKELTFREEKVLLNRDFLRFAKSNRVVSVYEENMPATIVFTSGTTGTPKGPVLSHDSYNIKVNQIDYGVPNIHRGDKFLAVIPFFAAYGSYAGMANSLKKGMNMFMIPKFNPQEFGDLICRYQIQTAIGVPMYWEKFAHDWPNLQKKYHLDDLSFLKNPVSGGDVVSPEVTEKCNQTFKDNNSEAKFIVGYGSSETAGPVATTVNNDEYSDNLTTGIFFPGIKHIFLDPETHKVVEGATSGELALHDPGMMLGYLDADEETEEITVNYNGEKYYNMGDIFSINEKGMLYFGGRTKRVIMRPDGHTVHAFPIEKSILEDEDVENVCAVGLKKKDNSSGTIPVAFVVLKDGIEPSEELVKRLDTRALFNLSERNRAMAYTFVQELPYSLMGKIAYKELEKITLEDLDLYVVDYTFIDKDYARTLKK